MGRSSRETTNSSWAIFSEAAEVHFAANRFCRARECVECLFQASLHQEAPTKIETSNIKLFSKTVCRGLSSCICLQAASTSFSSEAQVPSPFFPTFTSDSQIIHSSQALCERLQPSRPPQVPVLRPGFPHGLGVFQLGTVMRCRDTS